MTGLESPLLPAAGPEAPPYQGGLLRVVGRGVPDAPEPMHLSE